MLATSASPGLSARGQELLQKHNKPSLFQQTGFRFHSTTYLENPTITWTVCSVWAEMKTVYLPSQNCNCISNSTLCGGSFNTPPKQIKGLGDFWFPFFSPFPSDILHQGPFLLILLASCYLKPASTEMYLQVPSSNIHCSILWQLVAGIHTLPLFGFLIKTCQVLVDYNWICHPLSEVIPLLSMK